MSNTFSDLYVGELLKLLRDHASPTHDRLVLRGFPGIALPDLFDALLRQARRSIRLQIPQIPRGATWQAIELDAATEVIPYLVLDDAERGPTTWNQGMQGFAGRLRDFFAEGADRRRILLILDAEPIETELSASNPELTELLENPETIGIRLVNSLTADGSLARSVGLWFCRSVRPLGADQLDRLCRFLTNFGSNPQVAKENLHELRVLRPDPDLTVRGAQIRLQKNYELVNQVEDWAARPDQDLQVQAARTFAREPEVAKRLKRAGGANGVDWGDLTYPELKAAKGAEHEEDDEGETETPLCFADVPLLLPVGSHQRQQRHKGDEEQPPFTAVAAAVGPAHQLTFKVRLSRPLQLQESLHLSVWDSSTGQRKKVPTSGTPSASPAVGPVHGFTIALDSLEYTAGWAFFEISLSRGRTYTPANALDTCQVALRTDDCLFVEENLWISAQKRAFVVHDDPYVVFVHPDIGRRPISLTLEEMQSEALVKLVSETANLWLPLWQEVPQVDVTEELSPGAGTVHSPEEVLLIARPIWLEEDAPPTRDFAAARATIKAYLSGGRLMVRAGDAAERQMVSQAPAFPIRQLLFWEQQIMADPDSLRFQVESGRLKSVGGFADLESDRGARLNLEALENFRSARKAFFEDVSATASAEGHGEDSSVRFPSVLLLDTLRSPASRSYVEAYRTLLDSLHSDYRSAYQNLSFCDSIEEGENLFIAPTHPLAVAYLIRLQEYMQEVWAETDAPADTERQRRRLIGFRNATLPFAFLSRNGSRRLYHTSQPPCFLWQKLRPFDQPESDDSPGKLACYVREVLLKFITFHPRYQDPRQCLVITSLNPGDGRFLFEGLKLFYGTKLPSNKPQVELHFIGVTDCGDAFVSAYEQLPETSEMQQRVRYHFHHREKPIGPQDDQYFLANLHLPFIHITFASHVAQNWGELIPFPFEEAPSSLLAGGVDTRLVYLHDADPSEHRFRNAVWPGPLTAAGSAAEASFRQLVALTNGLVLAAKTATFSRQQIPAVLVRANRGLLPEVYRRSVWVSHLDPMIGVEVFWDRGDSDSIYMVDQHSDLRAVTGVQRSKYLLSSMYAALRQLGAPGTDAAALLRDLNAVSGEWAMALNNPELPLRILPQLLPFRWSLRSAAPLGPAHNAMSVVIPVTLKALCPGSMQPYERPTEDQPLVWLRFYVDGEAAPLRIGYWLTHVLVLRRETGQGIDQKLANLAARLADLKHWFGHDLASHMEMGGLLANLVRVQVQRLIAHGVLLGQGLQEKQLLKLCEALIRGEYTLQPGVFDPAGNQLEADLFVVEQGLEQPWLPAPGHSTERIGQVKMSTEFAVALLQNRGVEPLPRTWTRPVVTPSEQPEPVAPPEPTDVGEVLPLKNRLAVPTAELALLTDQLSRAFERNGLKMGYVDPRLAEAGPRIIRLRAQPLPGETIGRVRKMAEDLALTMSMKDGLLVDLDAPYICVDLPRPVPVVVHYDEVRSDFPGSFGPGELPLLLGISVQGKLRWVDLAQLPHLLVAGSTGSGKSVFLTTALCTLASLLPPKRLEMVIIDPKGIDFRPFEAIPHLSEGRVITDAREGIDILGRLLEAEIPRRKEMLLDYDAQNAVELLRRHPDVISMKVVVVDELAEMMSILRGKHREEFEEQLRRLAQMARALGIHLILATQRPSTDVLTGVIKANIPARLSFRLPSHVDSRTILDTNGAEKLLGQGDMLFLGNSAALERLQGVFTPRDRVREILASLK